jgi:glucose repression regulatory protein TUP1
VPSTDSDPGYEEPDWSIAFNNQVAKELDIEMIQLLSPGEVTNCVKFSPDGRYLAAGCWDGKAYIYDVETGALTW